MNPDCNWDDLFWVKSTSNFFYSGMHEQLVGLSWLLPASQLQNAQYLLRRSHYKAILISSIRDWFTLREVWLYLCPGLGLPPNFCHVKFKVILDSTIHTCNFIIYVSYHLITLVPCTLSVHRFHPLSGTNMQLQNEGSVHWDNTIISNWFSL